MDHRPGVLTPFSTVGYIVEFITCFYDFAQSPGEVQGQDQQFNSYVIQVSVFHGEVPGLQLRLPSWECFLIPFGKQGVRNR